MMENNLDKELRYIEIEEAMSNCLLKLSEGKNKCVVEYPDFRDIKVKIIGLNLQNIYHRAVHIELLEEGLLEERSVLQESEWSDESYYVKKNFPVKDTWIGVELLKNYKKEE